MNLADLLLAVLIAAIPAGTSLLYAALGELIYEKSGVLNLGVEGTMLLGAMVAVWGQTTWGSPWLAVAAAAAAAAVTGFLHAVLCVRLRTNQVVTGLAFVILLTGITAFWGQTLVGRRVEADLRIASAWLPDVRIGGVLFRHDALAYLAVLLAGVVWWFLFRTRSGAKLRAAGEDVDAARALGIGILRIRLISGAVAGAFAGIGGAHLSLAYASQWQENMVAGRGWIAVVLVIFARWQPGWVLISAYLFGGLSILQLNLQAFGVDSSSYLISMIPFVLAIAALTVTSWVIRIRPSGMPESLGKPLPWGDLG